MPDPLRLSISATEASVLFDANPYTSRWMLYRQFKFGEETANIGHNRMTWGQKLEPLVLAQAAEDLRFEVRPNRGVDGAQVYIRNGQSGCTRDADIICPDRGPGALETKCVFEYPIWMREWGGGNSVPKHIEIQVQQQMKVGDGVAPYKWGVIAVWIAGDIVYFKREPVPKFWDALETETARFFDDLANAREPEPFGEPREISLLNEAFPVTAQSVLDMREVEDGYELAEKVRLLHWHAREKNGHERAEKDLKTKLRAVMKDSEKLLLPNGINVLQKRVERAGYTVNPSSYVTVTPYVPSDLPEGEIRYG